MGTARWWVCDSCSSLNDLPARKCYKCHTSKPTDPQLIDDTYSRVSGPKRVSVSVDRSSIGDLVRPDPIEKQEGGSFAEAFGADADGAGGAPPVRPPYDPARAGLGPTDVGGGYGAPGSSQLRARPGLRPLRDPTPRGIEAIGGRHWTDGIEPVAPPSTAAGSPAPGRPLPSSAPGMPPLPPPPPPSIVERFGQAPPPSQPESPSTSGGPAEEG